MSQPRLSGSFWKAKLLSAVLLTLNTPFIADTALAQGKDDGCKECLNHATSLMAKGDNQAAVESLRAWQKKCPNNLKLHLLLSTLLMQIKDGQEESLQAAKRACQIDDASTAAHLQAAMLLTMMGRMSEAGQEYEKVTELDPANTDAWTALLQVYEATGDSRLAEARRKAASLDPKERANRLRLMQSMHRSGNTQGARQELKKLVNDPNLPDETFLSIGKEALCLGYLSEAAEALERYNKIKKVPDEAQTLRGFALYLLNDKNWLAQTNTDAGNGSLWKVLCDIDSGKFNEGRKSFETISRKKDKTSPALVSFVKGKLALAQGENQEAISCFEEVQKNEPSLTAVKLYQAQANLKEGDLVEAMSAARNLCGLADLAARARAIELRARLKDKDSSKKGLAEISFQVEKMSKEKPDDPALNAALGFLSLKEKDYARAREKFDKALALDPSNQDAILGLARLAKEEANPALAREMLARLSQLAPGDSEAKDLSDTLK